MPTDSKRENIWDHLRYLRPFLLTLVAAFALGLLWNGPLAGAVVAGLAWFVYWMGWWLRKAMTRMSWGHVAEEERLELTVDSTTLFGWENGVFEIPTHPLARNLLVPLDMVIPTRPEYRLDGGDVRAYTEIRPDGTYTVWEADAPAAIPDWLVVRPNELPTVARRWVDVEDVLVGHEAFDTLAVVRGPTSDRVRTFFWNHDLAESLLKLYEEIGPFAIRDGTIRVEERGMARQSTDIEPPLRRVRRAAAALREELSDRASDREQQHREQQRSAAYVYE